MPRKNLTARFCDSVKVDIRTDFQDEAIRGLSLRVSESGLKTWNVVFVRQSDDTKQRVKLGRYPEITLEKARTAALKMMTAIAEGGDPANDKKANRAALTIEALGAIYLEKHAKRLKKTWAQDERILQVEVYPRIGKMKAAQVKRRDLLDIIEAKAEAGHIAQSTQILAVIRKLFNWAVDSDYLQTSPAAGVKPRGKSVSRDRVLSKEEIRLIWNSLPDAKLNGKTKAIIRLLFLTGQRSGEVSGMIRSEIDLNRPTWTIPGGRAKNGNPHVVPLSGVARKIVELALAEADENPDAPLFTRTGEAIESNAIAKAVRLKLQVTDTAWTAHDIRRTVATGLAELGIAPHIVEAVLNHVSGFKAGVAGTYNRHLYEPEKRRALDIWAEHLQAVVSGKQAVVVPLARAAK